MSELKDVYTTQVVERILANERRLRWQWFAIGIFICILIQATIAVFIFCPPFSKEHHIFQQRLPNIFQGSPIGQFSENQTDSVVPSASGMPFQAPKVSVGVGTNVVPVEDMQKWRLAITYVNAISERAIGHDASSSQGSGVFVTNDGWMLTNEHVIHGTIAQAVMWKECTVLKCQFKIADISAMPKRCDETIDICLVKIPVSMPVQFLPFKNTMPKIGDDAYAFGNPENTIDFFSMGTVVNLTSQEAKKIGMDIAHNAYTNHGSSGGALIDEFGNLIGITSAINQENPNLGFAISSVKIQKWLTTLTWSEGEKRGK